MKYKAAIIGCGQIAGGYDENKKTSGIFSHAGAYKKVSSIELIACADINQKRLKEFSNFWKAPLIYSNYKEMLGKENLDILSICVPDNLHYQVILDALKLNKKIKLIFAEKPLAASYNEAKEIIKLADRKRIKIIINNQRRFEEKHREIRDFIKDKNFGSLTASSAYYVKGIIHIGCTIIDLARFLFGKIKKVQALPPANLGSYGKDKSLDFILFLANGSKVMVQSADKFGYNYSIFELDLLFEKGRIKICNNGDDIYISNLKDYRHYPGFKELKETKRIKTNLKYSILNEVKLFPKIISREIKNYENNVYESMKDLKIIEAIMESKNNNYKIIRLEN